MPKIEIWRRFYKGKFFYQLYFQDEGAVGAGAEANISLALCKTFSALSGDAPSLAGWLERPERVGIFDTLEDSDAVNEALPEFLGSLN